MGGEIPTSIHGGSSFCGIATRQDK